MYADTRCVKYYDSKKKVFKSSRNEKKKIGTLSLKAQWLLCLPTGLTSKNSKFYSHSIFVCSVYDLRKNIHDLAYSVDWF